MPIKFIVTSHGWSASNWLSYALNMHPEIICSHSAANLINTKVANDIRGLERSFHKAYRNRLEKSIDSSYEKIISSGAASSYGSVHLYRIRDLPYQYDRFSIKDKYIVFNLVRGPVSLVLSGEGQFRQLFKTDINELHWNLVKVTDNLDYLYGLADKYDLKLGDDSVLPFVAACRVLDSLKKDIDAEKLIAGIDEFDYRGVIRMEDITLNRECFIDLIKNLLPRDAAITEEYLSSVNQLGLINRHATPIVGKSERQKFTDLPDWKKDVFQHYYNKYALHSQYAGWGYDVFSK